MAEQIVTQDDIELLVLESNGNLNMALAGMTSLMEDNNEKIALIENQNWFQRMSNTILGKNKMTQEEIFQNHDRINLYITQAMGELFNRNCIDHEIILGLGNKINELYESQVEIKMLIGAFAQKLNQKIESIDNFHILITEINQNKYSTNNPLLAISRIMSQLDFRTVQDQRKMDILKRALEDQGILNKQEVYFSNALEDLLSLSENEAGILALFFGNIRNEYIAEITEKTIYAYYMLPERIRKMKSKHSIVESILKSNDIDLEYKISSYEMCSTLIDAYLTNIVEIAIEEQQNERNEKECEIKTFIDDSLSLLILLRDMVDTWEANSDEMNTYETRKKYSEFMLGIIDNLDMNSYIGSSIIESLNNLTFFAQKLFSKHVDMRICKITNPFFEALAKEFPEENTDVDDISQKVNSNVALEIGDEGYKTIAEYFKSFIKQMFNNEKLNRTRQAYTLDTMNSCSADFPDTSSYTVYSLMYTNMKTYVALYNTIFTNILSNLENHDFLEDVYELVHRFPVMYDKEYENIFMRKVEHNGPYIEFEFPSSDKPPVIGYAKLGSLENYATTVVWVKFRNIDIKGYTAHWSTIENSYVDFTTWDSHKYVDIEWGEWVDNDVSELRITKNNNASFGNVKIKITINQDPSIVGFIG